MHIIPQDFCDTVNNAHAATVLCQCCGKTMNVPNFITFKCFMTLFKEDRAFPGDSISWESPKEADIV